jgi:hypothetical protein
MRAVFSQLVVGHKQPLAKKTLGAMVDHWCSVAGRWVVGGQRALRGGAAPGGGRPVGA